MDEGTVTTRPLIFEGSQLLLNSDANSGYVLVEILNANGAPIRGYRKRDCDAVRSDSIRHRVTWRGNADLSTLQGKPIRLKFYLKQARLYSFQFTAGIHSD
jgi:hypothetical protein